MERIVQEYRRLCREHGSAEAELELRMGAQPAGGTFSPGVARRAFEEIEMDLRDEPKLRPSPQDAYVELHDYHYTDRSGRRIRTRVHFDSEMMELSTVHTVKVQVCNVMLKRGDGCDAGIRLSLCREVPVTDPPQSCMPTYMRIKQRQCFRDLREGGVVWSYELSKTWAGTSRSNAEHRQHVCPPTYEVECELVDADAHYSNGLSDAELAEALLFKARMLMGEDAQAPLSVAEEPVRHPGGGGGGSGGGNAAPCRQRSKSSTTSTSTSLARPASPTRGTPPKLPRTLAAGARVH